MPNVESVRVVQFHAPFNFELAIKRLIFGDWVETYLFHRDCWLGQIGGTAELIETDGSKRCAECRRRLDD